MTNTRSFLVQDILTQDSGENYVKYDSYYSVLRVP